MTTNIKTVKTTRFRGYWFLIASIIAILANGWSCRSNADNNLYQQRDFSALATANKMTVSRTGFDPPITISDSAKIAAAAEFANRYQDRWVDRFANNAPLLIFEFYVNDRHCGGYGIGQNYLTEGSLNRDDVPADQITALARSLGLQWPPRQ